MYKGVGSMQRVASVIRNALQPQARNGINSRYVLNNKDIDDNSDANEPSWLEVSGADTGLKRTRSFPNFGDDKKEDGKNKPNENENTDLKGAFVASCAFGAGHSTLVELAKKKFVEKEGRDETGFSSTRDSIVNHILPYAYSKPIFVNHMVDPSKGIKQTNAIKPNTVDSQCQTEHPTVLSLSAIQEAERLTAHALTECESQLQNWRGLQMMRKGLFPEAFGQLTASAQTNPKAMYNLGLCYFKGQGTCVNVNKAVSLWKRAAEMNHAKANYQLGVCSVKGVGMPIDKGKACQFMDKAASANLPQAQFWLGAYYLQTGFVEKGASLIDKAKDGGYKPATRLAQKIEKNKGDDPPCKSSDALNVTI